MVAEVVGVLFAVLALALFFFLPGFAWVRALWPEKRFTGPPAVENLVEGLTAGFLLSLSFTILIGFALGNGPGTFQAGPDDPLLEAILTLLMAGGLAVGWIRGGWGRPVPVRGAGPPPPPEEDLEEVLAHFEALEQEERELSRRLKASPGGMEAETLRARLEGLRAQRRLEERERREGL